MPKLALLVLLCIHGLIHLMGLAKAFAWAELPQLTLPISPARGVVWGAVCALFVAAALLRGLDHPAWWIPALVGVLVSQGLIALAWSDAKAGTVANVLILLAAVQGAGAQRFEQRVADALGALHAQALPVAPQERTLSEAELRGVPEATLRYLRRSGALTAPRVQTLHLRQRGRMQTSPGSAFMPFEAEQWFVIGAPSFVWRARVDGPLKSELVGLDVYRGGRGQMRIELLSLLPVVDASGPKIDQGTLLRYLGETAWFPSALIHESIALEAVDENVVRATMTYGGVTASGEFTYSESGELLRFSADRYREDTLTPWVIEPVAGSERQWGARRIASQWRVTWELEEGPWTWLELELLALTDNPER